MTEVVISDKPVGVGYSYVSEWGNDRHVREKRAKVVSKLSRQLAKQLPKGYSRRCSAGREHLEVSISIRTWGYQTKDGLHIEGKFKVYVPWAIVREPTTKEQVAGRLTDHRITRVVEVTLSDTDAANKAIDKINELLTLQLEHLEEPNSATDSKVQKDD